MRRKIVWIPGLILLLVVIICTLLATVGHEWSANTYTRLQAERKYDKEIKPFKKVLHELGFKDLGATTTKCAYEEPTGFDDFGPRSNGAYRCEVRLNQTIAVPTDQAGKERFNSLAAELSTKFNANKWYQRPDLPIVQWFREISKGVDYQPDTSGSISDGYSSCTISFFTAFSKPDPARMSLDARCTQYRYY